MSVQERLNAIQCALEHCLAEEELLELITSNLKTLRQEYTTNKNAFTKEHIAFLQSLTPISKQLGSFIALKEELLYVNTLKHYTFLVNQLVDIKNALRPFAVCKRISKEIRELTEKLPIIRQEDEAKQQVRLNARIAALEHNPWRCPRQHKMVIREGRYGYFRGCSKYPLCQHTQQLAPHEKDNLYS